MQYMLPLLNMQAPLPAPPQSRKHQQQLMRTVSISILVMSLPVLYVSYLHVPPAALFRDTTFWFLMSNSIIIVIAADSGMLFFGSSSYADADDDSLELSLVKDGLASTGGASVVPDENQALVVREHGDLAVIAEHDHAYALVMRDDQGEGPASEPVGRELMVVSQPPSAPAEAVAFRHADGAIVPASRSPAREERPTRRRRHGHRPSRSHALMPVQDKSVVVREEKEKHLRRQLPAPEAEEESEYSRLSDEELNRRVEEFITMFNREIRLQLEEEQSAAA